MSIDKKLKNLSITLNDIGYKKESNNILEIKKQADALDYVPGGSYIRNMVGEQQTGTPEQQAAAATAIARARASTAIVSRLIDIDDPNWLYSLTADGKGYMAHPRSNPFQPRLGSDGRPKVFSDPAGLAKVKAGKRYAGTPSSNGEFNQGGVRGGLNQPDVDVFQEGTWADARSGTPQSTQGHRDASANPQMGAGERLVKYMESWFETILSPLASQIAAGSSDGSIPLAIGCFLLHICGYRGTLEVTDPNIRRAVTFVGMSKEKWKDANTIDYYTIKAAQTKDPNFSGSPGPIYIADGAVGGPCLKAGVSNPYSALSLAVGTGKIKTTGTGDSRVFVLGDYYNFWTGAEGQRAQDLDKYIVNARNLIGGFEKACQMWESARERGAPLGFNLGSIEQGMIWRQRITGYNGFQVNITSLSVAQAKGS